MTADFSFIQSNGYYYYSSLGFYSVGYFGLYNRILKLVKPF